MTDPTTITDLLDRYGLPVAFLALCVWAIVALYKRGVEKDGEVMALAKAVADMNTAFTTWDQLRKERETHERETLHARFDALAKQLEELPGRIVRGGHGAH